MGFLENLHHQEIFKRLSPDAPGAEPNIRHSKIAVRHSDEVFFAHRSTVRCTKISQSQSYKVLDILDLDFVVKGLKINSSGTLLAIYSDDCIIVTTLPSANFMQMPNSLLRVKSFRVGLTMPKENGYAVTELEWNRVARFDSSLVVLYSDGFLRVFDLSTSSETPESSFDLSSPAHNQVGLVTSSITNPVSMSFGSHNTLSGSLSLYILNGEGDIFSIYPFLPKRLAVEKDHVEDLLNESVLMTNDIVAGSSPASKRQLVSQLKFVKSLWNQIPTCQKEIRGAVELCVLHPETTGGFAIQGPFAIQPYPEALYDDTSLTLTSLRCGSMSLLGVTFAKNGFVILLPDPGQSMKFQDAVFEDYYILNDIDKEPAHLPLSLSVLDFKSSSNPNACRMTSIADCAYLQRGLEIFEVDLSKWAAFFDEVCINGEGADTTAKHSTFTAVRFLKSLGAQESYEGSITVTSGLGENFRVIITSSSFEVIRETCGSKDDNINPEPVPSLPNLKLGAPFSEIERLVADASRIRVVPPTNSSTLLSTDESSLRDLNDVSSQVLKQVIKFHKLGLGLNYRAVNQKTELERQIDTAADLIERHESSQKRAAETSAQLDRAMKKQERIIQRFQVLAEKVQREADSPLSTAEKHWFKEIQKLAISFNTSAKQNLVLKEQLRFIKGELDSRSSASAPQPTEELDQWGLINQIMKEGRQVVEQTSKSLEESLAELKLRVNEAKT